MKQLKLPQDHSPKSSLVNWFFDQTRKNILMILIIMLASFGVSLGYHRDAQENSDSNRSPSSIPVSESSESRANLSLPNSQLPPSVAATYGNRPGDTFNNNSNLSSGSDQNQTNPPPAFLPQTAGQNGVPRTPNGSFNAGNHSDSSQANPSKGLTPSDSKAPGPEGDAFPGLIGSVPTPTPSPQQNSQSTFIPSPSGLRNSNFPLGASNYQISSGGGTSSAAGMQVTASFGEVTSSGIQSAVGVSAITGMKGILYQ